MVHTYIHTSIRGHNYTCACLDTYHHLGLQVSWRPAHRDRDRDHDSDREVARTPHTPIPHTARTPTFASASPYTSRPHASHQQHQRSRSLGPPQRPQRPMSRNPALLDVQASPLPSPMQKSLAAVNATLKHIQRQRIARGEAGRIARGEAGRSKGVSLPVYVCKCTHIHICMFTCTVKATFKHITRHVMLEACAPGGLCRGMCPGGPL
jgi:hypothetical protein